MLRKKPALLGGDGYHIGEQAALALRVLDAAAGDVDGTHESALMLRGLTAGKIKSDQRTQFHFPVRRQGRIPTAHRAGLISHNMPELRALAAQVDHPSLERRVHLLQGAPVFGVEGIDGVGDLLVGRHSVSFWGVWRRGASRANIVSQH